MEVERFELGEHNGRGLLPIVVEFARISVVLGKNGAGKSALLNRVADACRQTRRAVLFVSGKVVPELPTQGVGSTNAWTNVSTLESARAAYQNAHRGTSSERFAAALAILFHIEKSAWADYSRALSSWRRRGKVGAAPPDPMEPFQAFKDTLREFVPDVEIVEEHDPATFPCRHNGRVFNIGQLSDGEKQVLSHVADLLMQAHESKLVIVDEPELHLHPGLAARLWGRIERAMPSCRFLYATQSVEFASRPEVQCIYVVRKGGGELERIEDCGALSDDDRAEFLGALPGVLWQERIAVVEGRRDGRDERLVRWMLRGTGIHVQALGNCRAVKAAVDGAGPWKAVLKSGKLVGIVDRDFGGGGREGKAVSGRLFRWPFNEIESLLCLPDVIESVTGALERPFDRKSVEDLILLEAKDRALRTAARRVAFNRSVNLTVRQTGLGDGRDHAEVEGDLLGAVADARKAARACLDEHEVKQEFEAELRRLQTGVSERNLSLVLAEVEGRSLAGAVLQALGLGTIDEVVEVLIGRVDVSKVPSLRFQVDRIESLFTVK